MFNETAYNGLGAIDTAACAAIKLNCDTRFPVDPNDPFPTGRDLNWECMVSTGYTSKCMENKSYNNPGATMYIPDLLTNPDNPNTIWQWPQFMKDLADTLGISPTMVAAGGGLLLLIVVGVAGRR